MANFREVQQFRQPWLWAALLASFSLAVWVAARLPVPPGPGTLLPPALTGILLAWFYTLRLTVEVSGDCVDVSFWPLWTRRRIAIREIRSARATRYNPILDYGGWGVRWSPWKGRAYNVSGDRGVMLELTDGSQVMIGSQRPEALEQAIAAARGGWDPEAAR